MTCPNCYCAECQKERAKWGPQHNFQPYVAVPNTNYPPGSYPPGSWHCGGCGALHPPGYVCLHVVKCT